MLDQLIARINRWFADDVPVVPVPSVDRRGTSIEDVQARALTALDMQVMAAAVQIESGHATAGHAASVIWNGM